MLSTHEESVYMAKLVERYEEIVEFMEKVSASVENEELTVEERNLLSVAYKNGGYKTKIESELSSICDGILKLLDSRLIPSASAGDSKVFYLKIKGDYHRYLAKFKIGAERKKYGDTGILLKSR